MLDTLYVTFENQVLVELPREDAVKAFCIQFSALYVFGANYEVSHDGKSSPEASAFFNFITIYRKIHNKLDFASLLHFISHALWL